MTEHAECLNQTLDELGLSIEEVVLIEQVKLYAFKRSQEHMMFLESKDTNLTHKVEQLGKMGLPPGR